MEDDDNVKEDQIELKGQNEKEKRVLELLKDVEDERTNPEVGWTKFLPRINS